MNELPAAKPLSRLGTYVVDEATWTNPLPEQGMPPTLLATYWLDLVEAVVGRAQRQEDTSKAMDAAELRGDVTAARSLYASRYTGKITLKTAESVIALLHGILVSEAPFLCDAGCPHVAAGATREQVKRFLDSLDAATARARQSWKETHWDHPCYEDLQDEFSVYEECRRKFAKLLG